MSSSERKRIKKNSIQRSKNTVELNRFMINASLDHFFKKSGFDFPTTKITKKLYNAVASRLSYVGTNRIVLVHTKPEDLLPVLQEYNKQNESKAFYLDMDEFFKDGKPDSPNGVSKKDEARLNAFLKHMEKNKHTCIIPDLDRWMNLLGDVENGQDDGFYDDEIDDSIQLQKQMDMFQRIIQSDMPIIFFLHEKYVSDFFNIVNMEVNSPTCFFANKNFDVSFIQSFAPENLQVNPLSVKEINIYFKTWKIKTAQKFNTDNLIDNRTLNKLIDVCSLNHTHKEIITGVTNVLNKTIAAKLCTLKKDEKIHITTKDVAECLVGLGIATRTKKGEQKQIAEQPVEKKSTITVLKENIFGQDEALDKICDTLDVSNSPLLSKKKPNVLGFFGPSGVGKTETARVLGPELSGQPTVVLNMSEYSESHSVAKLIGPPPGYVGYNTPGLLHQIYSKTTRPVIVLDEIEKANQTVHDLFLGAFDTGNVHDNVRGDFNMSGATFILTSNAGIVEDGGLGFGNVTGIKSYGADQKEIERAFKPEFLGRLDEKIIFKSLEKEALGKIIDHTLREPIYNLKAKFESTLELDDNVRNQLIQSASDPKYGARNLKQKIRTQIILPLSRKLDDKTKNQHFCFNIDPMGGKSFNMIVLHKEVKVPDAQNQNDG